MGSAQQKEKMIASVNDSMGKGGNITDGEVTDSEVDQDYSINVHTANESQISKITSINRKLTMSDYGSRLDGIQGLQLHKAHTEVVSNNYRSARAGMPSKKKMILAESTPVKLAYESVYESDAAMAFPTGMDIQIKLRQAATTVHARKPSAETTKLDKIRDELLLFANRHIDLYDTYPVALVSKKVAGLEVRQINDPTKDDSIVTVAKAKIPGMTLDMYKEYKVDVAKHTPKLDSKQVMTKLDDHEGHMQTHTLIKMPMMMTNRSVFNLYHMYAKEDGSWIDVCSMQGTESAVESPAGVKLHGKNVFCVNHCDYRHIQPYDDGSSKGCYWTSVLCTDIGGSIPNYLKAQGAGEMARNAESLLHFVMTGKYS